MSESLFITKTHAGNVQERGTFRRSQFPVNAVKEEADDKAVEKAGVDIGRQAMLAAIRSQKTTPKPKKLTSPPCDKTESTRKNYPSTQTGYTRDERNL